jgi:O-antigen ligase
MTGLAAAGILGGLLATRSPYAVPALWYLSYALIVAVMPLQYVPALMLAVFVLIPVKFLPVPTLFATSIGPNLLAAVIFALRCRVRLRGRPVQPVGKTVAIVSIGTVGWLALATIQSSARGTSFLWSLSFCVLALGVAYSTRFIPQAAAELERAWLALGGVVAAYAVLEAFVLHANPVFGSFYEHTTAGRPVLQVWSVYRATTTLGHPLVNGLFLACTFPIAVGWAANRRSLGTAALAALVLAGVAATGSRGALLAAVIGGGVALAIRLPAGGRVTAISPLRLAVACVVGLALLAGAGSVFLGGRQDSEEGRISSDYRSQALTRGMQLIRADPLFGSGPGTAYRASAGQLGILPGDPSAGGALENSWLELAVAAGLVGLVLVLVLLAEAVRAALAAGNGGVLGALVAFVASAASFNWLEGYRGGHVLLGLLLGLAFVAHHRPTTDDSSAVRARAS